MVVRSGEGRSFRGSGLQVPVQPAPEDQLFVAWWTAVARVANVGGERKGGGRNGICCLVLWLVLVLVWLLKRSVCFYGAFQNVRLFTIVYDSFYST